MIFQRGGWSKMQESKMQCGIFDRCRFKFIFLFFPSSLVSYPSRTWRPDQNKTHQPRNWDRTSSNKCFGVGTETRNVDRRQNLVTGTNWIRGRAKIFETETGTVTGTDLRGEGSKIQFGAETKALFSNKIRGWYGKWERWVTTRARKKSYNISQ